MSEEYTFYAKVVSNGRITIPELIREKLKLSKSDVLKVTIKKEPKQ